MDASNGSGLTVLRAAGDASGELRGPKLNGKVRPVGADWALLRPEGVTITDVRATIETDDGALISAAYTVVSSRR